MKTITILSIFALLSFSALAQEDFGTLIFNKQIAIGMTFGNVQAAWGQPRTIDRSFSESGVTEYWFYNNGWLVTFVNGRVARFSHYGR